MMEDIDLTIRSSIALLESINSYVHMLPIARSAHFLQWQSWPTSGLSACPAPRNQSPAQFQLFRQACLSLPCNAMHLIFTIKHARQPTCAACQIARGIRIKSMRRRLAQTAFPFFTLHALKTRTQGVDTPRHADVDLLT